MSYTTIIGIIAVIILFSLAIKKGFKERALLDNGVSTTAEVLSVKQLASVGNGGYKISMKLKYKTQTGDDFLIDYKNGYSAVTLPYLKKGSFIPIKYDRKDPGKIVVDLPSLMEGSN
ncbi:hypothetical protein PMPD1_0830 [Paramixta manurensis]|uniref:DUF3592 domain-containing protein n=1 Tax=Paramixta manurensis TaxID=2740817 RepID=A0A6M8UG85_9GAMM|nr:hypothetical protein PMPD1_0830 [Erwiniaceae bacterium PD-1]